MSNTEEYEREPPLDERSPRLELPDTVRAVKMGFHRLQRQKKNDKWRRRKSKQNKPHRRNKA